MSELLPCPFCGGPASIENVKGKAVDELRRSAGCDNEECHGYMSMQTYPRIADAVKAWNTRHPEPAQAQVSDPFADKYHELDSDYRSATPPPDLVQPERVEAGLTEMAEAGCMCPRCVEERAMRALERKAAPPSDASGVRAGLR